MGNEAQGPHAVPLVSKVPMCIHFLENFSVHLASSAVTPATYVHKSCNPM